MNSDWHPGRLYGGADAGLGALLRLIYSLALYLAVPYLLWHLWWRGRRNPAYRRRWSERFGYVPDQSRGGQRIWIHAVSVGEVQACIPLIRRIRSDRPELGILLTTTTPMGAERARAAFGDGVDQSYLPYDLPGAVSRFLSRVEPRLAVFVESDLWPNLIRCCGKRGIPVVVINARLSERSAHGYRRVAGLTRAMLARVSLLAAQSDADAGRFISLGLKGDRVRTVASLKFDWTVPAGLAHEAETLRGRWGAARPVWIAASTHPGEEEMVLAAHRAVLQSYPAALLLLVPRHPERAAGVAGLASASALSACLLSQCSGGCRDKQIVVSDGMGQLPALYAASQVAFVGGSLVPRGGHNPLEPAALGIPVLTGCHIYNAPDVHHLLLAGGAALQVSDAPSLGQVVIGLLSDKAARDRMGRSGRQVVADNRGAVDRLMALLAPYLEHADQKAGEPTLSLKA